MRRTVSIRLFVLMGLLGSAGSTGPLPARGQDDVRAATFAAGAGYAESGAFTVRATIGQPIAGPAGAGSVRLGAGSLQQIVGGFLTPAVTAVADVATTPEDEPVIIDVLQNDLVSGDVAVSIARVTQPAHAEVTHTGDGRLRYAPAADYHGLDAFAYVLLNSRGDSATAAVTVTVDPVNDAPTFSSLPVASAVAGMAYVYEPEAVDVDGDALAFLLSSAPDWLQMATVGTSVARISGVPPPGVTGQFEVVVTVSDGSLSVDQPFVLTVTLTEVLTARSDAVSLAEDATATIRVLANDSDPMGAPLSIRSLVPPKHGTAVVRGDTTIVYSPHADFHGADTLGYTAQSASGDSAHAWVHLTVTPVNDPPVFLSTPDTVATPGTRYRYQIEAADVDGDSLALYAVALPQWLTMEGGTEGAAVLVGTPDASHAGPYEVAIGVNDGSVAVVQTFALTVDPALPSAPIATAPLDGEEGVLLPVTLEWEQTGGTYAFRVQIAADRDFATLTVDSAGIADSFVKISGLLGGTKYYWRVRATNASGQGSWSVVRGFMTASSTSAENASTPHHFALAQNYPNPFNPETTIEYATPRQAHVSIEVFDLLGRRIALLLSDERPAGRFRVIFDASRFPGGTYVVRMRAGDFTAVRKMILLK